MPESIDTYIKSIQSKMQLLLKNYTALQKENSLLIKENHQYKSTEKQLLEKLNLQEQQLHILKASAGKLEGKDRLAFEKNISKYIRSIDKCIGMLNN